MKRIIVLVLAFLLIGGMAFADTPGYPNTVDLTGWGGQAGVTPPQQIIKVRYGLAPNAGADPGLTSGEVMVWDTNSADGFTVSACVTSKDATYAGILVTTLGTADDGVVRNFGRNVGWICIKGYALAQMEANATAGEALVVTGIIADGDSMMTTADQYSITVGVEPISQDIGTLLQAPTTEGDLMPVWLN